MGSSFLTVSSAWERDIEEEVDRVGDECEGYGERFFRCYLFFLLFKMTCCKHQKIRCGPLFSLLLLYRPIATQAGVQRHSTQKAGITLTTKLRTARGRKISQILGPRHAKVRKNIVDQ